MGASVEGRGACAGANELEPVPALHFSLCFVFLCRAPPWPPWPPPSTATARATGVRWSGQANKRRVATATPFLTPFPPFFSPATAVPCAVCADAGVVRVTAAADGTTLAVGGGWRAGRRLFYVRRGDGDGTIAVRCATDAMGDDVGRVLESATGEVGTKKWKRCVNGVMFASPASTPPPCFPCLFRRTRLNAKRTPDLRLCIFTVSCVRCVCVEGGSADCEKRRRSFLTLCPHHPPPLRSQTTACCSTNKTCCKTTCAPARTGPPSTRTRPTFATKPSSTSAPAAASCPCLRRRRAPPACTRWKLPPWPTTRGGCARRIQVGEWGEVGKERAV